MEHSTNLLCRHCGSTLATNLKPVEEGFKWVFDIQFDVVPPGRYAIGDGSYSELTKDHIIVHLDDLKSLTRPPDDEGRGYGCCGYWDGDGPNLVCVCGAEIGFELSDCAGPRMAHFATTDVMLSRGDLRDAG